MGVSTCCIPQHNYIILKLDMSRSIIFALCVLLTFSAAHAWREEKNTELHGWKIAYLPNRTVQSCKVACDRQTNCAGFDYITSMRRCDLVRKPITKTTSHPDYNAWFKN